MSNPLSTRDPRIPKALALRYQDGPSYVNAYARDISMGGLFITTESPLKQGARFPLKLQLPGLQEPIHIECEVAWAKKQLEGNDERQIGMGVKFIKMPKEYEEILKPYIKTVERLEFTVSPMSEKDDRILKEYLKSITSGLDKGGTGEV